MLGLFTALLLPMCTALAQPAWPPNAATVGDYIDMGSSNNTVGGNKRINMDMFGHYANASSSFYPDDHVIAVAFDDVTAGEVRLMVWDVGVNIWRTATVPGATQPDVVLLDDPGLNMGVDYYVALVYELAGNVEIRYFSVTGVSTVSFSLTPVGNVHTLNTASGADNPHIDAAPTSTMYFPTSGWSPGLGLHAFTKFAVTWHQAHEIWAGVDNNFAVNTGNTTVTNKNKVDDGLVSDVAFALIQDNPTMSTYYKAYYIYDKGNDIRYAELTDAYNPGSLPAPGLWSALGTVVSPPRIDCGHFHHLNGPGDDHWQAVVGMQNGTLNEIHSYGFTGGTVTTTNFSAPGFIASSWPTNPLASDNAYYPTVAAASFHPGWNVGAAFAGNTDHMMGFLFDYPMTPRDHFMAVTQAGPLLNTQMGYDEVDMGGVNASTLTTGNNNPALALSYGTNTSYGNTAAFSDGTTVYVKKPKNYIASPPMFKTTEIVKVPISRGLSVYPNPATNQISLSGLSDGTKYVITDVVGKQYTEGIMNKTKAIDISGFPAGIYIVSASSGNEMKHLKLVKE
jgi:hypothetical protein